MLTSYEELVWRSEQCKALSRKGDDFTTCRQFDELARSYRRLAEQARKLDYRLRRTPAQVA